MYMDLIQTDDDVKYCIEFNVKVGVWVSGEFDGVYLLVDFNDSAVKTSDGFYYLRSNIVLKGY